MSADARVTVLRQIDGAGTCLVPALILHRDGTRVTVLLEHDGAFITAATIAEYAQPPALPETVAAWQQHWQRLEAAAADRRR